MNRRTRIIAIVIIAAISVAGIRFGAFTGVKTGTVLRCKYNHTIRANVYTSIVPRWRVGQYGVMTTTITCQKHKRLEKLRADALAALKRGDTATAKKLFEEIKRVDPVFQDVNTQLGRLNDGTTNPASPANPVNPATPPPAINLPALLPSVLAGYKSSQIDSGESFASRNYRPDSQARMQSLLVTVHSTGAQAAAEQFIIRVDQVAFSKNGKNTTVNGYSAYFGTDGITYATLAWAKGTIVYELQAHSSTGNPADLESDLAALAAAFN